MHTDPSEGTGGIESMVQGVNGERGDPGRMTRPSVAVVEAVADTIDCDPYDVPPLYEIVDPDALDALFSPKYDGTPREAGMIVFTLAGCEVTVFDYGRVTVRRIDTTATESESSPASDST